eukprot:6212919-Pleurochrysis_carterae.AAC.3
MMRSRRLSRRTLPMDRIALRCRQNDIEPAGSALHTGACACYWHLMANTLERRGVHVSAVPHESRERVGRIPRNAWPSGDSGEKMYNYLAAKRWSKLQGDAAWARA